MVLQHSGQTLNCLKDVYECSSVQKANQIFLSQPIENVGPNGLLMVLQSEMAAVAGDEKRLQRLGTDDATTCHMVILRHPESHATILAHLDGTATEYFVESAVRTLAKLSNCDVKNIDNVSCFTVMVHLIQCT